MGGLANAGQSSRGRWHACGASWSSSLASDIPDEGAKVCSHLFQADRHLCVCVPLTRQLVEAGYKNSVWILYLVGMHRVPVNSTTRAAMAWHKLLQNTSCSSSSGDTRGSCVCEQKVGDCTFSSEGVEEHCTCGSKRCEQHDTTCQSHAQV